jgi:cellulose synthase/poly-beta-1,6-N-acetylglucosamine synthase-like glycosyltransferase
LNIEACSLILRLYRYVRLVVNIASSWTFKSIPLPNKTTYTSDDVTVVIPTICRKDQHDDLQLCLQSICKAQHFEVLLITTDDNLLRITKLAHSIDTNIRVTAINVANKRWQIAAGIPSIRTKFALLADDDVVWPPQLLPHMLPPFEDHTIGAVGTCQRIRQRRGLGMMGRIWQYLGACYIERRNFEIAATSHIDGGISCLSGRTAAVRTNILQRNDFVEGYINERWQGKILNTDDDNFVTRYLVANGWGTCIQISNEAEVQTTLECNWGFLLQCLRWARSNLRSNISSMLFERHVWKYVYHPSHLSLINSPSQTATLELVCIAYCHTLPFISE